MVYSKLPWRPFLRHQAWSWTTLRRGNVFLLRLQTFFIFVTFLHFLTFFLFLFERFLHVCYGRRVPLSLKCRSHWRIRVLSCSSPRNRVFLDLTRVQTPNRPTCGSSVFAGVTPAKTVKKNGWTASDVMINTHTSRHSMCSNSPHLALFVVVVLAMRAKNYNRTTQCKFQ